MAFLTRNRLFVQGQLPPELNDKCLDKAIGVLDVMGLGPVEREIYENRQKFLMIEEAALAHQYLSGKLEGEAIGIEKGESKAKRDMALKMLLKNKYDDEDIIECSGLTLIELMELKSTLS
jgi:hypothetical protein